MSVEHAGPRNAASTSSSTVVSQIRDLLPFQKHAVFHVKLVIHQLQSVPLISGAFRVNWKFRHLQAVNSAGRPLGLGRALALKLDAQKRRRAEEKRDNVKGKGKQVAHDDEDQEDQDVEDGNIFPSDVFPDGRPDSPQSTHTQSKQSTLSTQSTSSSTSTSISNFNITPTLNTPSPSSSQDTASGIDYYTEARGHTSFLPLHDYQVDFETEVNVAVQLSIERDSLALLPSELKLIVMQQVIPNDPEAPLHPRLGHVQLNLAEYVGAGAVTRNYLLRRSKVNAMLNMTITMTHLSGESTYHAPPLRKEEIKAGISEFLATSSTRSLLPALGRYLPATGAHEGEEDYDDPWVVDALGEVMRMGGGVGTPPYGDEVDAEPGPDPDSDDIPDSTPDLPGAQRRPRKRWRVGGAAKRGLALGSAEGPTKASDANLTVRPKTPGHDEDHVSHATKHSQSPWQKQLRELHPTEALIEAIFNPYPSASDAVSPFTYRVPSEPTPTLSPRLETGMGAAALGIGLGLSLGLGSGQREGTGTDGTSRGSFDSSSPAGASASASASTSEQGHVGGSAGGHSGGSLSVNGDERGHTSAHRWWRRRRSPGDQEAVS